MKFSYFASIKSKQCRQLSVAELLDTLRVPSLKLMADGIKDALQRGDETAANNLKSQLPVVVLNELYKQNAPRKQGSGQLTGIVMIDYDNCESEEQLDALCGHIQNVALAHPILKDYIVAAHISPRRHGVHVWYKWLPDCHDIKECHAKFANLANLPDYDEGCNDSSRCSYVVPLDYFFVQCWSAMEHCEPSAELQKSLTKNGNNIKPNERTATTDAVDLGNVTGDGGSYSPAVAGVDVGPKVERPTKYEGIEYERIFKELVIKCAPASKLDDNGNVMQGARDNTLFKVVCLFRYICENNPDWVCEYLPNWALDLDKEQPGRCRKLVESACSRGLSFTTPRTLAMTIASLKESEENEQKSDTEQQSYVKELDNIEAGMRKFFELPAELPPVFKEITASFPFAWKPAAVLSLLPMLGTIMSRIRGTYLDKRVHSPSFQTVIEAKFGRGKGNITDLAKMVLEPLEIADEVGNNELNIYNAAVEKSNGTEKLPDKPDVCVRKITGDFTVAGFEEVLNTSKGLHIWCGTSEIDEVRKIWAAVSHILRKAYDNDMYGRSLQSTKTFRGERPVYFNTLLCGTSRAINRCYADPEDGLVSRTLFFKLMLDDEHMPVVKMQTSTRNRLNALVKKLHDSYSLSPEGKPVPESFFCLDFVNKALKAWLGKQYQESVRTGNSARDSFRRRDAVNGFRAALVATAIYSCMGVKLKDKEKKVITNFALWVANYGIEMHLLKYGKMLNRYESEDAGEDVTPAVDILQQFPKTFTIREAYRILSGRSENAVRIILSRLLASGYLVSEERGLYSKK